MKIIIVVGARPNFMKAAPIISAINKRNQALCKTTHAANGNRTVQCMLVHTGQHYSELMSDQFFEDLGLPRPSINLGVGSGSHATQTAEIMRRFEPVIFEQRPDAVVVVGDVNSTLACSLVTAKADFTNERRPIIAHVEAGLRSFDRTMPEECNRILTDHLSDLLFVTEESGIVNLRNEGISQDNVFFVGNTMIDSLKRCSQKAKQSPVLDNLKLRNHGCDENSITNYALLTLHRPANVDDRAAFVEILAGLNDLRVTMPVIFPVHPRTCERIREFRLEDYFLGSDQTRTNSDKADRRIQLIPPLGYIDFLCLMTHATLVVTDSGGIQEETTCLGVPCVTIRENTERPITIQLGTNVLAGVKETGIKGAIRMQMQSPQTVAVLDKWDGKSGERIVDVLITRLKSRSAKPRESVALPSIVAVTD